MVDFVTPSFDFLSFSPFQLWLNYHYQIYSGTEQNYTLLMETSDF